MIAPRSRPRFNTAVLAAASVLVPTLVFWLSVLINAISGVEHSLLRIFAGLEESSEGLVVLVTIVLGCPFFALPLAVIGRWLAKVRGERGESFGTLVVLVSAGFVILGVALPLALR